jgi:hypothetical protein
MNHRAGTIGLGAAWTAACDDLVQFVAGGLVTAADDALRRIERLLVAQQDITRQLKEGGARGVALDLVEDLVASPFITASQAAVHHHVTYPPANNAIQQMVRLGILRQWGERSYGRIYICDAMLNAVHDPLDD